MNHKTINKIIILEYSVYFQKNISKLHFFTFNVYNEVNRLYDAYE